MRNALMALLLTVLFAAPRAATSQDLASLVADSIAVDPSGSVTASGNVEVFFQGTRLRANRVSYSSEGDQLTITGPIRITDESGTVFLASEAQLDRDLRNGVLVSARLVLDQQLQLAANEIARVDGRYTRLDRVVASSCQVCAQNPTPLWEIRASRVIHDEQERQLYFEDAQFRIAGLPVFYFPRLRLPDPSMERGTGLLIPQIGSSSELGFGVKLPYFIALGDHADVTLTPYLSNVTTTLEFEYRHLTKNGRFEFEGAVTQDDLEGSRAYFFGTGELNLPKGFVLFGRAEIVSDSAYLFDYDYSDKDRLTNEIGITRVRNKDRLRFTASAFKTLREAEEPIQSTLPSQFIEGEYLREIPALSFGGRTTASIGFYALERPSSVDVEGRDVSRLSSAINWKRGWTLQPGIIASTELGFRIDAYSVAQDSNFDSKLVRAVPRAAAELRWPMSRRTSSGATEVLEPILRVDVSDTGGDQVPNEDSRVVEFDEANLFAPTRYPGYDGAEDGVRVAIGASWQRVDPNGWVLDVALGRIASLTGDLGYGEGSGLEGDRSEWLLSGRLSVGDKFQIISRSLFDNNIEFTLSETRIDWRTGRFQLGTNYIYAVPEPSEDRVDGLSEWNLDGQFDLSDRWSANARWRYDFNAGRAARAGLGLDYHTDCADIGLTVSRRFADSSSIDPTTDYGFRVSLSGISGRESDKARLRRCRG